MFTGQIACHQQSIFSSEQWQGGTCCWNHKELTEKEKDPYLALLAYRSTPLEIGYSPSQLLMNRALHTTALTSQEQRKSEVLSLNIVKERDVLLKEKF